MWIKPNILLVVGRVIGGAGAGAPGVLDAAGEAGSSSSSLLLLSPSPDPRPPPPFHPRQRPLCSAGPLRHPLPTPRPEHIRRRRLSATYLRLLSSRWLRLRTS
ncbi:hypothetical protein DAI22_02g055500 [Oryza sativa Japonica Group]|nr:hypothetical protein DAI22_02g055500 [Oryza sativa Japonica Group]